MVWFQKPPPKKTNVLPYRKNNTTETNNYQPSCVLWSHWWKKNRLIWRIWLGLCLWCFFILIYFIYFFKFPVNSYTAHKCELAFWHNVHHVRSPRPLPPREGTKKDVNHADSGISFFSPLLLKEKSSIRLKYQTPVQPSPVVLKPEKESISGTSAYKECFWDPEKCAALEWRIEQFPTVKKPLLASNDLRRILNPVMRHHTIRGLHHELYKHAFLCLQRRSSVAHSAHSVSCS